MSADAERKQIQGPAKSPCGSCPYRLDVPSGVWSAEEYAKLPAYDADTAAQPPGVFLCHQQDGRVCAGWAGCHDGAHLLSLRMGEAFGVISQETAAAVVDYVSPVPLHPSGRAAADYGLAEVAAPKEEAWRVMDKLERRRRARG